MFLQLMEGEKANQSLRGELRDQEELVHRLMSLETENTALSAELSQVQIEKHEVSQPIFLLLYRIRYQILAMQLHHPTRD